MAITFRNAASANANTVAITTPAAKDLIVVFAFDNAAATVPTVPAGYVSKASNTTTLCGGVCATRISDGTETSVPAFTNATQIVAVIYRGAFDVGAVASGVGNSNVVTYPALTLKIADGTSWVTAGAIDKGWTAGSNGTTTALTSNRTNQTTCNGLDTTGGVASYIAQTLTGTGSGRFVAFSAELIAQPLISETLTQSEGAKTQIRGGSFDFNLIDSAGLDTVVTGTAGSEAMAQVDMLRFVDANKAAFVREVDLLTQSDTAVVALGILATAADQLTQSDAMLFKLLGGSFVYQLLDASGTNSVDGDTTGQDQLVQVDPTFTETLELDLSLFCPEFSGLWNDYGGLDFVLTPSQVEKGDFTPWSLNALPGNTIPFENFEYVLTPSAINVIEHGWVGLLTDSYSQVLGVGGLLTEALSDTMTMSDALAIGYGQGQVDALSFSDSSSLGFGDLISDTLSLSDSEAAVLGFLLQVADSINNWADAVQSPVVPSIPLTAIDFLQMVDGIPPPNSGPIFYIGDFVFTADVLGSNGRLAILPSSTSRSPYWVDFVLLALDGNYFLRINDAIQTLTLLVNQRVAVGGNPLTFANQFLTEILMKETAIEQVAIAEIFSDTLTLSDSDAIGYGQGQVDSLTFSDANSIGYGDLIADTLSLSDSESNLLGLAEVFSDTLSLSDSITAGYGNAVSDQIVLTDSTALLFSLNPNFSETLNITDSSSLGYGFLISDTETLSDSFAALMAIAETLSDTMTLSDSLIVGYGQGNTDALTFSDSSSVGFGDLISDSLTQSDSERNVLGINELFSDQLVLTDSLLGLMSIAGTFSDQIVMSDSNLLGYGFLISDTETLTDSAAFLFTYGTSFSDTLTVSDSSSLGYGFLINDSFALSDSETNVLGIIELLADALSFSDALAIGYGNAISDQLVLTDSTSLLFSFNPSLSETIVITDSNQVGYGFVISDNLNSWADFLQFNTGSPEIDLSFSEDLVLTDSDAIGYGQGQVDALTFADSSSVGFGDLISDTLVLSDSEQNVLGMLEAFADQLTQTDSMLLGYGLLTAEQLVQTDSTSLLFSLNSNFSETLTITDSAAMGYGFTISDSESLTDSTALLMAMLKSVSDSFTLIDSLSELLAGALGLSDSLTQNDALTAGYGNHFVEQLTIVEGPLVGFGDLIADSLTNWLDNFQFTTGQPAISLSFSESISIADQLGAGYGNQVTEQNTLNDSAAFIEAMNLLIADASPAMLEAFQALMTYGLQVNDALLFQEQLFTLYGLLIADTETMSDAVNASLLAVLTLALSDSETSAWFEAVVLEAAFAPGEIIMGSLTVLNEMIGKVEVIP